MTINNTSINYNGSSYNLKKGFKGGTHRICPPAETYRKIEPYFKNIGLTRLANITGLDNIGIPVVLSVRPNGTYLSVDAGKGFSLDAANVSAAMECIERYHAENVSPDEIGMTYKELDNSYNTVPIQDLPLTKNSIFNIDNPQRWSIAWDIMNDSEVAVPTSMLTLKRSLGLPSNVMPFQIGTNGLASGNKLLEAFCAGLYEIVERDAVTCNLVAEERINYNIPKVRLETIESALVLKLLGQYEEAGIKPVIYDCTIDTDVPTYMSFIYDIESRAIGIYKGYGAHLDPEIAMIRALTEAAQSRLIYISGSRDDFFRCNYRRLKRGDDERTIDYIERSPETVDAGDRENESSDTFEEDIIRVFEKLKKVNINQIIALDLTLPEFDIAVVRIMGPGLEGYKFDYYSPGHRALAFLEKLKSENGELCK